MFLGMVSDVTPTIWYVYKKKMKKKNEQITDIQQ